MHLTSQPIKMGDTALGRHQEVIKRQVDNVITKMSKKERGELKRKLESMEEKDDSPEDISVMPNSCTKSYICGLLWSLSANGHRIY